MNDDTRWVGVRAQESLAHRAGGWLGKVLAWVALAELVAVPRLRGENRADYRYEDYEEEGGRIHIRTHGVYFDTVLRPWVSLKGNYIYDGISGATPTGAPPLPGSDRVPLVSINDIRRAGYVQPTFTLGNHAVSPQVSYSRESDYESVGVSVTHSVELNEKNTTLSWGVSHSFDRVLPNHGTLLAGPERKNTTDAMVSVTQLLGPRTVVSLSLTVGYAAGYLSDPYKRVLFLDFPYFPGQPYTVWPEVRPDHKLREVLFLSGKHYVPSLRGAVEGDYRLHHDDFGIWAHTATLQWHQDLWERVIVTPLVRYHRQTAATFYGTAFPGDPSCPPDLDPSCPQVDLPGAYSADYRLSALESWTFGARASLRVHRHATIDFGYKHYRMSGTDGVTAGSQYPTAQVFTLGFGLTF